MDKVPLVGWCMVCKEKCKDCDASALVFDDNFIDYHKICAEHLTAEEIKELKPEGVKTYPFIYYNGKFFGGFLDLVRKYG